MIEWATRVAAIDARQGNGGLATDNGGTNATMINTPKSILSLLDQLHFCSDAMDDSGNLGKAFIYFDGKDGCGNIKSGAIDYMTW